MSYIRKIIDISGDNYLASNEARVVNTTQTSHGLELDDRKIKTAACDEARLFIRDIEPIPGYAIILVSAMGSFEYWGGNKKADAFTYESIIGLPPRNVPMSIFDKYKHRIPKEYGMSTFKSVFKDGVQTGGGNTFWEHQNKAKDFMGKPFDPLYKPDPRMGFILNQFWNPVMNRVEIVQTVSRIKLPSITDRIDNGELIGISMACDVPFDRCGKCNHLSVTNNTYCEHLRDMRLRGSIDELGFPYVMFNDFCRFFDSTLTERPAAVEGRMLIKVASTFFYPSVQTINNEIVDSPGNEIAKSASDGLDDYQRTNMSLAAPNDQEMRRNPDYLSHNLKENFNDSIKMEDRNFNLQKYIDHEEPFSHRSIEKMRHIPIHSLIPSLGLLGIFPTELDIARLLFNEYSNRDVNNIATLARSGMSLKPSEAKKISIEMKISFDDNNSNDINNILQHFASIINTVKDNDLYKKSYLPEFLFQRRINPLMKTASDYYVDATNNLDKLGQQAQAVLLVKLLYNPDLINQLGSLLKSYYVRSELKSIGLDPSDIDLSFSPVRNSIQAQKLEGKKIFFS